MCLEMRFNSNVKFLFEEKRKKSLPRSTFEALTTLHGLKTRI